MRILLVGILLLGLLAPAARAETAAPVFAAGDTGEIDLFKGALDLTIWTIVVFLLLFFILGKFAWPQVLAGLRLREENIARAQRKAEQALKETDEVRTKLTREMAEANEQVRLMIDKARQDAAQTAASELARGKAELQAERERLTRDVDRLKEQALQEIWEQAAGLATLISNKTIRKSLGQDDHRALLAESLDEFRSAATIRRQDLESAKA